MKNDMDEKRVRDILGRCLGDSLLVREESGMAARDEESWSMSMDIGDRERVGRMAHTSPLETCSRRPFQSCLFG